MRCLEKGEIIIDLLKPYETKEDIQMLHIK